MLRALGLTSELAGSARAADSRPGRVLGVSEGVATVLTEDGPVRAGCGGGLLRAVAADPEQAPCAGDWVVLRDWPDRRVTLERVLPRHGTLLREPPPGPLAANVDLVGLVLAARPAPVPADVRALVERVQDSGAALLLVLARSELVADPDAALAELAALAGGPGEVPAVAVSVRTGAGLGRLRELAGGRTLALVGAPAAGCAALCRALAGTSVMRAGPAPWLLPLPGGGAVVAAEATSVAPAGPATAPPRHA